MVLFMALIVFDIVAEVACKPDKVIEPISYFKLI